MRKTLMLACCTVLLSACAAQAQNIAGWRGDGSGKYPNATAPLHWGRAAKSVAELRAQASKPKDGDAGKPVPDGVIREWLVLGPLPIADSSKSDEVLLNAETLAPDENEKTGDLIWRAVALQTGCMDLCALMNIAPEAKGFAAYVHTYLYSPSGGPVVYNALSQGQGTHRVWLNGAAIYTGGKNVNLDFTGARIVLPLKKGWNRLLVLNAKTLADRRTWWLTGSLYGDKTAEYETHGVVWTTPIPYPGSSAPVIAGDRIFFTAESGSVVCVNKADGKILWVRTLTYYDFATDEERKTSPAIFAELDPLAVQVKQADQLDAVMPWKAPALEKDYRWSFEGRLFFKGMSKVDAEKYNNPATWGCEAGYTGCTPATDGENVYALFGSGIVASFDRDGNRRWARLLKHTMVEHGYATSPLLIDGKLVVYLDDFTVLDAKTGAGVLERPHYRPGRASGQFYGTGIVLPAGNEKVLYYMNGEFVRLSDGKTLSTDNRKLKGHTNNIATPVVQDGVAYKVAHNKGGVVSFKLPPLDGDKVEPEIIREVPFSLADLPYYYEPFYCASPLFHDGLLYCVNDFGWLTVLDMAKGEIVYQRLLDIEVFMPYNGGLLKGGASSSPTLAGKYIYIWGNQGTCVVLEPGRTFKPVARNRIENFNNTWPVVREATMTDPVFEGGRMYYRGQYALYCIGEK